MEDVKNINGRHDISIYKQENKLSILLLMFGCSDFLKRSDKNMREQAIKRCGFIMDSICVGNIVNDENVSDLFETFRQADNASRILNEPEFKEYMKNLIKRILESIKNEIRQGDPNMRDDGHKCRRPRGNNVIPFSR